MLFKNVNAHQNDEIRQPGCGLCGHPTTVQ